MTYVADFFRTSLCCVRALISFQPKVAAIRFSGIAFVLATVLAMAFPGAHLRADEPLASSFSLTVGTEYDNNITLDEEPSKSKGDAALIIGFDAEVRKLASEATRLYANYSFTDSRHQNISTFDIQTHIASGGGTYSFASSSWGLDAYHIDARVGGSSYLTMQQLAPSFSHYFSTRFYARSALTLATKRLEQQSERDAHSVGIQSDIYFFQNGTHSYWVMGYRQRQENADTRGYDYQSQQLNVRWIKKISWFSKEVKARVGAHLEKRDYHGSLRDDLRRRLQSSITMELTRNSALHVEYEFGDYQSQLSELDYTQHVVSLSATYFF